MSELGVVLVHGYLGTADDLAPLASALRASLGAGAVAEAALPGHGAGAAPPFDTPRLLEAVARTAAALAPRRLVLVGHSMGGALALAAAPALPAPPALVVLAGTPPRIDAGYPARWERAPGARGPELADLAALARLVRDLERAPRAAFPLLVLQGDEDALVPAADAERWRERADAVRLVRLPGGGHDLFRGPAGPRAVDAVVRAVEDARRGPVPPEAAAAWRARAPALAAAAARWPATWHHLRESPAGRALEGLPPALEPAAGAEPTLLNLGITTRCQLTCPACARTLGGAPPRDLGPAELERVLEAVPHASRVVLVGLGEPLLHPRAPALVERVARAGRQVSLVTNGMLLDRPTARALLAAGLSAITVSLDAVSPAAVGRVRPGTDVHRVLEHLRGFAEERDAAAARGGARCGLAVFTAVAADTLEELPRVLEAVRPLGVDAVMATDLNFPENAPRSLHRAAGPAALARLDGALRASLLAGLPVLAVDGLEELALPERHREFLLLRGEALARRSGQHARCRSPWQCLPVGPDGEATFCDCQPGVRLGNVLREPLAAVWNGEVARAGRRAMRSAAPPAACRACPRF